MEGKGLMFAPYLLCAIFSATEDVELLHFSAPWCHSCQESEPAVRKFEGGGFPIRHFNVDERPDLARQYKVQTVPSFILVSQSGRPIARLDRPVTYEDLSQFVRANTPRNSQASAPSIRSPRNLSRTQPRSIPRRDSVASTDRRSTPRASLASARSRRPRTDDPASAAVAATVRLKIEDRDGHSYGTGTIVDVHGQEALILTCGHIFRDSKGKGRITVDLFAPGSRQPVAGRVLRYDLENDLALVAIKLDVDVTPARVAFDTDTSLRGDKVFSVGCNHGSEPTVMQGRVNAINRYVGPPANIVVAGQPVDGRSGGGLFSEAGLLIGVCQAADPEYKEGIYGHLPAVHKYFDAANLSFIYNQSRPAADNVARNAEPSRIDETNQSPRPLSSIAQRDRNVSPASGAGVPVSSSPIPKAFAQGDGTEVVCIVRSKTAPNRPSRVIVLDRPSNEFLQNLTREQSLNEKRELTELRVNRRPIRRQ